LRVRGDGRETQTESQKGVTHGFLQLIVVIQAAAPIVLRCRDDYKGVFMIRLAIAISCLFVATGALAQAHSSQFTEDYQREALEMFRDVISMRTAAGHGKVPEMANYLAQQFLDAGFDAEDVQVIPQTISTGEEVASLVVRYRGNGLANRKPVLLLAHMDVVDAIRSDWVREPYELIEDDGFFFGRGTSDNKTGIVTLTSSFMRLQREGFTPTRDLIIAFSGDEETTMETIQYLLSDHRHLVDAEYVLNSDAGGGFRDHDHNDVSYHLQAAEKTYVTYQLTIRNPGGHSSLPRPDNAIYDLATVLKNVEAYQFPPRLNEVTAGYFQEMSSLMGGELGEAMEAFVENPNDKQARSVISQVPAFNAFTGTTCVATMLKAGHAENALPQPCAGNYDSVSGMGRPDVAVTRGCDSGRGRCGARSVRRYTAGSLHGAWCDGQSAHAECGNAIVWHRRPVHASGRHVCARVERARAGRFVLQGT
jgi:acetylornithine deacetylase/succinyl-diaminopimelate desuccinylase-like protein